MDYLNNPDCSENKNIFLFKNCSYCSESGKMDKLKGPEHSMLINFSFYLILSIDFPNKYLVHLYQLGL